MPVDPITSAIAGLNFSLLTNASLFFHSSLVMAISALLLTALAYFTISDKRKIFVIIATLLLAFAVSESTKPYFAQPRPCPEIPAKTACPSDYSFPSGHAIIAFALMAAMLGETLFPLYFLFAIFIAFSRIYLGVHTFFDIAASLALAFACFAFVKAAYAYALKAEKRPRESSR